MWDLSDVSHTWYAIMQLGIRLKKEERGYAAITGPNMTSFGGVGWTES
jgi:hypothetical protein